MKTVPKYAVRHVTVVELEAVGADEPDVIGQRRAHVTDVASPSAPTR